MTTLDILYTIGGIIAFLVNAYLLYRANEIFEHTNRLMERQNEILAKQEKMPVNNPPLDISILKRYWPIGAMSLLTILTWSAVGYDIYQRHRDLRHPLVVEKPVAGNLFKSLHGLIQYVWIPPGTFKMGCARADTACGQDEKKQHDVTLSHGFWIGQNEVSVEEYGRYVKAHNGKTMPPDPPFNRGWDYKNQPIVNLTWEEARNFCAWDDGRLPSEAEWEYAAKGRSETVRSGDIDEIAWYLDNSNYSAHDVAQKSPNYIGLYDTLGNAWEWVNDWWSEDYYDQSPAVDPPGPPSGNEHVLRGGSYRLKVAYQRFSGRNREGSDNKARSYNTFGVRCARD